MSERRHSGRVTFSLLFFVTLVVGVGAWNYHRNWTLERESGQLRVYAGYARQDLVALREAHDAELTRARSDFEVARRQRVRPGGDRGSVGENVEQFDATTRASRHVRETAAIVAEHVAQLEQIDRELERRSQLTSEIMLHVKRLVTL
jgi:hypothetical protein